MKEFFFGFSMEQWVIITFCVGFDECKGIDGAIESIIKFKDLYEDDPDEDNGVAYAVNGQYKIPERTHEFYSLRKLAHTMRMVDYCPVL